MAKYSKRRKTRKASSRRRRVSGVASGTMKVAGMAIAGAIISNKITAMLKAKTGTMATIAPYAGLILGIGLPMIIKNPMVKDISLGLLIGGGLETLKQLAPNLLSGPYRLPVVSGRNRLNGGVYSANMVGGGHSPMRSSAVNENLSVVSGIGAASACL